MDCQSGVWAKQVAAITGGACAAGQLVKSISTTGVPTCESPVSLTYAARLGLDPAVWPDWYVCPGGGEQKTLYQLVRKPVVNVQAGQYYSMPTNSSAYYFDTGAFNSGGGCGGISIQQIVANGWSSI